MLNQEKIEMAGIDLWPGEVDAIIRLLEQEEPRDEQFLARVKEFREELYSNSKYLRTYFPGPGEQQLDADFIEAVREKFS